MTKLEIEIELNERYQDIGNISKGRLLDELMYLEDKGYIDGYRIINEWTDRKDEDSKEKDND